MGRGPEIAAVRERLRSGRVVTLTGPGGCGKTRLALRVAALAEAGFGDGARLVELAPLTDPALVPASVAQALGVSERDAPTPAAGLVRELAGRELLVVLDNCEHVLEAAAGLVATLLAQCRRVRFLATSRERLDVPGELVFPVPPLGLPADGTAAAVAASEAGLLFAARAGAASPAFELSAHNSAAVAQVCARLDGIPLAIELAAARCPALGPAELAARLDGHPGLLSGGPARPGRHRSLEALVAWSYELLDEAERRLLARLSVLRGGFDLGTAERVAAGAPLRPEAIAGLLASLAGKSVVRIHDGAAVRYSLLETIRQFAAGRLAASGEETAVHRRLLDWALGEARSAEATVGSTGWAAWASRLSAGQDSIRAALSWALGGAEPEAGRELAARLARWWIATGRYSEAGQFLTTAAGIPAAADQGIQARVLLGAAWSAFHLGDNRRAAPLAADGIACARQAGEPQLEVWGRNLLAGLAWHAGDADRIVAEIEASRALSGQADPALAARAQILLATAAFLAGDLAEQDAARPARGRARPDGGGPGRARPRADHLGDVRDRRSGHPARHHGRARRGRDRASGASGPLRRDDHAPMPRPGCSPPWASSTRPKPRSDCAGPRDEAAPSGWWNPPARWPRPASPPPGATPRPPSARCAGPPTAGAASGSSCSFPPTWPPWRAWPPSPVTRLRRPPPSARHVPSSAAAARRSPPPRSRYAEGVMAWHRGELAAAEHLVREATVQWHRCSDRMDACDGIELLGVLAAARERHADAARLLAAADAARRPLQYLAPGFTANPPGRRPRRQPGPARPRRRPLHPGLGTRPGTYPRRRGRLRRPQGRRTQTPRDRLGQPDPGRTGGRPPRGRRPAERRHRPAAVHRPRHRQGAPVPHLRQARHHHPHRTRRTGSRTGPDRQMT